MKKKEKGRSKRKGKIPLVAMTVLLSTGIYGCDFDPSSSDEAVLAKRDVYTKFEDCIADWGDKNLCQQMQKTAAAEDKEKAAVGMSGGHTTVVGYPYFFGPTYYGDSRVAFSGDRQIAPSGNRASNFRSTAVRMSTLPSSVSKSISARGGFGSAGRGVSAGS